MGGEVRDYRGNLNRCGVQITEALVANLPELRSRSKSHVLYDASSWINQTVIVPSGSPQMS
jgi:hypothetical protein